MSIEHVQAATCLFGISFSGWMVRDLFGDLLRMYRSGSNGFKETQCWGALMVALLLCAIQLMYFVTALAPILGDAPEFTSPDAIAVYARMALRGTIASAMLTLVTVVQRFMRRRLYTMDVRADMKLARRATDVDADAAADRRAEDRAADKRRLEDVPADTGDAA